ncbi:MAG: hypothetical protein LBH46_02670 [Rickettsiales bacterium]|jgi:hypothetical protein|nr:hypothetical protein [Rickettsiales bacterium]
MLVKNNKNKNNYWTLRKYCTYNELEPKYGDYSLDKMSLQNLSSLAGYPIKVNYSNNMQFHISVLNYFYKEQVVKRIKENIIKNKRTLLQIITAKFFVAIHKLRNKKN